MQPEIDWFFSHSIMTLRLIQVASSISSLFICIAVFYDMDGFVNHSPFVEHFGYFQYLNIRSKV